MMAVVQGWAPLHLYANSDLHRNGFQLIARQSIASVNAVGAWNTDLALEA